jgi:restriction system protein
MLQVATVGLCVVFLLLAILLTWMLPGRRRRVRWDLGMSAQDALAVIDRMDGTQFEWFLTFLYDAHGFATKHVGGPRDFGADVLVRQGRRGWVIQAKRASHSVGAAAVSEVYSAVRAYEKDPFFRGCRRLQPVAVTNLSFRKHAQRKAGQCDVELRGRDWLAGELHQLIASAKPSQALAYLMQTGEERDGRRKLAPVAPPALPISGATQPLQVEPSPLPVTGWERPEQWEVAAPTPALAPALSTWQCTPPPADDPTARPSWPTLLPGLTPDTVQQLETNLMLVGRMRRFRLFAAVQYPRLLPGRPPGLPTHLLIVSDLPLHSLRHVVAPIVMQLELSPEARRLGLSVTPHAATTRDLGSRIQDGDLVLRDVARSGAILWAAGTDDVHDLRQVGEMADPGRIALGCAGVARQLLAQIFDHEWQLSTFTGTRLVPMTADLRHELACSAVARAGEAVMLASGHQTSPGRYLPAAGGGPVVEAAMVVATRSFGDG